MTKIPKFENTRFVGAGTFSFIYRVELSGKPFALKLAEPGIGANAYVEFEILSKLKGTSGVPQVYDFFPGTYKRRALGISFSFKYWIPSSFENPFLMDFFPAPTLREAGPQKERFFDELRRILFCAQDRGIVAHTDIHDENVLVHEGRTILLDWGRAEKFTDDSDNNLIMETKDLEDICNLRRTYQKS